MNHGAPISIVQLLPLDEKKKSGKKKVRRQKIRKKEDAKLQEGAEVRKEGEGAGEKSDRTSFDAAADVYIGKEEKKEAGL